MKRKTKLSCIVKVKSKIVRNTHFCNGVIVTYGYTGILKIKINDYTVMRKEYVLQADDWDSAVNELESIHGKYVKKFSS